MPMMVKRGSQGPAVGELQGNLRSAGAQLKADGIFGPATEAAVRSFQQAHGLTPDGIVGARSWSALHRSRTVSPSFDPFDPEDYAKWLRESAAGVTGAIGGLFGGGASAAPAGATATHATAPGMQAPRGRPPHDVPHVAATQTPRPPEVSSTQNRQHDRIAFAGYEGRGYVLKGFEKYENWEVQLIGHKLVRPFTGMLNNECAQFVQLFGVPRTSTWRAGPQVCHMAPGSIPVGTVVATLRDGIYHNDYSGRSHVGIYMGHDPYDPAKGNGNAGGVRIMDQWNHAPILQRPKPYSRIANEQGKVAKKGWTDTAGHRQTHRVSWAADGEEYFVLVVR